MMSRGCNPKDWWSARTIPGIHLRDPVFVGIQEQLLESRLLSTELLVLKKKIRTELRRKCGSPSKRTAAAACCCCLSRSQQELEVPAAAGVRGPRTEVEVGPSSVSRRFANHH